MILWFRSRLLIQNNANGWWISVRPQHRSQHRGDFRILKLFCDKLLLFINRYIIDFCTLFGGIKQFSCSGLVFPDAGYASRARSTHIFGQAHDSHWNDDRMKVTVGPWAWTRSIRVLLTARKSLKVTLSTNSRSTFARFNQCCQFNLIFFFSIYELTLIIKTKVGGTALSAV